ncbi:MAG TPA: CHRD domain-containing protein [Stellaceae bacterium]|jgi:hypothetical protein|nr:CHRD domain-containing protein [Stellaceae bacterium]
MIKNTLRLAAGVLLAFGFATGAYAQYGGSTPTMPATPAAPTMSKSFHASLSGAQEVPPVAGNGTASADFKLDAATKTLTWTVTYSGLSSDAVAAHIHGPAAMGANAGVEVNLAPGGMASPLTGSAVLTDAQITDLSTGNTYINIHTANNKGGEIRGQITPKM